VSRPPSEQELLDQLRALPLLRPPLDRWPLVRARVVAARRRRSLFGGAIAAGLLALALSATAILQKRPTSLVGSVAEPAQLAEPAQPDELAQLIEESQRREEKLRSLSEPEVMNVGSADAIVQMEDQIALVDECIAEVGTGADSRQVLAVLWQTRITLLDALAQVRRPALARLTR
jgi:hypothetical protein